MAQYKHYSKDFKLQATRLITEQGYSLKDAAQKLGVSAKGLELSTFGSTGRHYLQVPKELYEKVTVTNSYETATKTATNHEKREIAQTNPNP